MKSLVLQILPNVEKARVFLCNSIHKFNIKMHINDNYGEPSTAIATFAFFGLGQLFGYVETFRDINTVLSTISFVVSISVGVVTLVKAFQRWRKK